MSSRAPRPWGVRPRTPALRVLARSCVAAALCAGLALPSVASGDAPANASKVSVGEVSTVDGHADTETTIRSTLAQELPKVKVPNGKRFVVSASLVKLETKTSGSSATTSATISLAVRDAKNGAIRGFVNGSSQMSGRADDAASRRAVVEHAVRGATKSLPAVIEKAD